MADPEYDTPTVLDLPIQPTGSGVLDLEIAREQDALAEAQDEERADDEFGDVTASGAE